MKYLVHLSRHEIKTVPIFAESPHDAVKMARESHPGFVADELCELAEDPDEPGEEIQGDVLALEGNCESCGKPIITGDAFYQWSCGDDSVKTCFECGGADENHPQEIAG